MYAIYGNNYHPYTPNVSRYIYTPYMDPMGYRNPPFVGIRNNHENHEMFVGILGAGFNSESRR
jgi:hypothetical protein